MQELDQPDLGVIELRDAVPALTELHDAAILQHRLEELQIGEGVAVR